jgi:hypothetical protein
MTLEKTRINNGFEGSCNLKIQPGLDRFTDILHQHFQGIKSAMTQNLKVIATRKLNGVLGHALEPNRIA